MNAQSAGERTGTARKFGRPDSQGKSCAPGQVASAPTAAEGGRIKEHGPRSAATAQELWLRVVFLRLLQFGPSVHVAAHSAPHRRFYSLGTSPAPPAAACGRLEVVSRTGGCARVPCREAGSPCKSSVTELRTLRGEAGWDASQCRSASSSDDRAELDHICHRHADASVGGGPAQRAEVVRAVDLVSGAETRSPCKPDGSAIRLKGSERAWTG
jgi:hypothetical protein